jgi:tetratricopeptide (TPR) repeat protein
LRADLALWGKTLDNGSDQDLALARRMLTHWQVEPDLAGIRDLKALGEVTPTLPSPMKGEGVEASAEERNECFALWDQVGAVLRRVAVQGRAIALDPNRVDPRRAVPIELLRQGQLEEARVAWRTALEGNPLDHNAWFGYAELCLFLGREVEYRRARRDLLARFFITKQSVLRGTHRPGLSASAGHGGGAGSGRRSHPARRGVRPIGSGRELFLVPVRPGLG